MLPLFQNLGFRILGTPGVCERNAGVLHGFSLIRGCTFYILSHVYWIYRVCGSATFCIERSYFINALLSFFDVFIRATQNSNLSCAVTEADCFLRSAGDTRYAYIAGCLKCY